MTADRDFEVMVFGATGLVGRYVSQYLFAEAPAERWAVCARSADKLSKLMGELSAKHPNATCVPEEVIANAKAPLETLQTVICRTRVLINCAGPYAELGAGVVAACVAAGTHYVDVTGEPLHILRSMKEQGDSAREKGVLIIPACAFDHAVAEILCINNLTARMRVDAASQDVQRPRMIIEMFGRLQLGEAGYFINTGTLDSTIGAVLNVNKVLKLERELQKRPADAPPLLKHKFRFGIYREPRLEARPVVIVLDGEALHVRRTLNLVDSGVDGAEDMPGSDQIAFRAFMVLGTWTKLFKLCVSIVVCALVPWLPGGRAFILRHAPWFTWNQFRKNGPSDEQVRQTKVDLTFFGQWKNDDGSKSGHVSIRALLEEPTYVATSRIAIASALTILEERDALPGGGVLTPGFAFFKTNILKRMEDMGIFQYVQ